MKISQSDRCTIAQCLQIKYYKVNVVKVTDELIWQSDKWKMGKMMRDERWQSEKCQSDGWKVLRG